MSFQDELRQILANPAETTNTGEPSPALAAFLRLCSRVPELVPGTAAPSDGRSA